MGSGFAEAAASAAQSQVNTCCQRHNCGSAGVFESRIIAKVGRRKDVPESLELVICDIRVRFPPQTAIFCLLQNGYVPTQGHCWSMQEERRSPLGSRAPADGRCEILTRLYWSGVGLGPTTTAWLWEAHLRHCGCVIPAFDMLGSPSADNLESDDWLLAQMTNSPREALALGECAQLPASRHGFLFAARRLEAFCHVSESPCMKSILAAATIGRHCLFESCASGIAPRTSGPWKYFSPRCHCSSPANFNASLSLNPQPFSRWPPFPHRAMGELVTIRVQTPPAPATETAVPYETILAHPEQYFQAADIVWVMAASTMVFIMVPALSLIYAALSNRSFAMTMFRLPLMTAAVVGLQWVFWGYSLTFTDGGLASGWYGGEKRANALVDVIARPITVGSGGGPPIPELLFVLYEGMFASFTYVLPTNDRACDFCCPRILLSLADRYAPMTARLLFAVVLFTGLDLPDSWCSLACGPSSYTARLRDGPGIKGAGPTSSACSTLLAEPRCTSLRGRQLPPSPSSTILRHPTSHCPGTRGISCAG